MRLSAIRFARMKASRAGMKIGIGVNAATKTRTAKVPLRLRLFGLPT